MALLLIRTFPIVSLSFFHYIKLFISLSVVVLLKKSVSPSLPFSCTVSKDETHEEEKLTLGSLKKLAPGELPTSKYLRAAWAHSPFKRKRQKKKIEIR